MSVVEDALTAASAGVRDKGVTSMQAAKACGLWGGLFEVARASKVGMRIEKDRIPLPDEVAKICALFDINPYSAISEGTLIITCRKFRTGEVIGRLEDKGILAAAVGETLPEEEGVTLVEEGRDRPLDHPRVDPFWEAFGRTMTEETGG